VHVTNKVVLHRDFHLYLLHQCRWSRYFLIWAVINENRPVRAIVTYRARELPFPLKFGGFKLINMTATIRFASDEESFFAESQIYYLVIVGTR
jgi:hypothetical protein